MLKYAQVSQQLGYMEFRDPLVTSDEVGDLQDSQMLYICTGSQGQPMSVLSRLAFGNHAKIALKRGDTVILSSSPIPGNEEAVNTVINRLYEIGVDVLYPPNHKVHASGHGSRDEQLHILNLARPKYFLPWHGEPRHQINHARLAQTATRPPQRTLVAKNGDIVKLTPDDFKVVGTVPAGAVYVDGLGVGDISDDIIMDRMSMSQEGVLIITAVLHPTPHIELVSRGFVRSNRELETQIRKVALEAVEQGTREKKRAGRHPRRHVRRGAALRAQGDGPQPGADSAAGGLTPGRARAGRRGLARFPFALTGMPQSPSRFGSRAVKYSVHAAPFRFRLPAAHAGAPRLAADRRSGDSRHASPLPRRAGVAAHTCGPACPAPALPTPPATPAPAVTPPTAPQPAPAQAAPVKPAPTAPKPKATDSLTLSFEASFPAVVDGKKTSLPYRETLIIPPERLAQLRAQGKVTASLDADLGALLNRVMAPARDARFEVQPDGQWAVVQHNSFKVDTAAARAALAAALKDGQTTLVKLTPTGSVAPKRTLDYFVSRGITAFLAGGQTGYDGSSPARITNIHVGTRAFQDKLFEGETFSFNRMLGPITTRAGFVTGLVIAGERTASGIGGGICQVSTTVFRALYGAGSADCRAAQPQLPGLLLRPPGPGRHHLPAEPGPEIRQRHRRGAVVPVRLGRRPEAAGGAGVRQGPRLRGAGAGTAHAQHHRPRRPTR